MFQVKEREKQGENTREKARGYVVDGRIRKKGWVSTGVNWLVWWANVCLLAASEPVNHYGLRKRPRATFTLSSISSRSLLLSLSDHHALSLSLQFVFSFILFLPSRWLLSLSLSLAFPICLSFPSPSTSRFLRRALVPFISLSTKFTPLFHATSTLQCCLPPPILHI